MKIFIFKENINKIEKKNKCFEKKPACLTCLKKPGPNPGAYCFSKLHSLFQKHIFWDIQAKILCKFYYFEQKSCLISVFHFCRCLQNKTSFASIYFLMSVSTQIIYLLMSTIYFLYRTPLMVCCVSVAKFICFWIAESAMPIEWFIPQGIKFSIE